jgi:hypothetical protein
VEEKKVKGLANAVGLNSAEIAKRDLAVEEKAEGGRSQQL